MKVLGHISREGKPSLSPSSFTLTGTQAKRSIVQHPGRQEQGPINKKIERSTVSMAFIWFSHHARNGFPTL